jgi:hypothetical protein
MRVIIQNQQGVIAQSVEHTKTTAKPRRKYLNIYSSTMAYLPSKKGYLLMFGFYFFTNIQQIEMFYLFSNSIFAL